MSNSPSPIVFDKEKAEAYDDRFAKLAPMRDAIHLVARLAFSGLQDSAHILCVGAGTGAELCYLASAFPGWTFSVVDPSKAMMDICRARAKEGGFEDRCEFTVGYASDLPKDQAFNAATSILVSHFLTDSSERTAFFAEIYQRLHPGGLLLTADLASEHDLEGEVSHLSIWMHGLALTGMEPDALAQYRSALGRDVAVLTPKEVSSILQDSGFATTKLVTQTLLMHSWLCQKAV